MSYSISITAPSKAHALDMLAHEFDEKVIRYQSVHAREREVVLAHAKYLIALLGEQPPGTLVSVGCNGYLSWDNDQTAADKRRGG